MGAGEYAREGVERLAGAGLEVFNARDCVPCAKRQGDTRDTNEARALVAGKFGPADGAGNSGRADLLNTARVPGGRVEVARLFTRTDGQLVPDNAKGSENLGDLDARLMLEKLGERDIVGSCLILDQAEDLARDVVREGTEKREQLSDAELLAGLHFGGIYKSRKPEKEKPFERVAVKNKKNNTKGAARLTAHKEGILQSVQRAGLYDHLAARAERLIFEARHLREQTGRALYVGRCRLAVPFLNSVQQG